MSKFNTKARGASKTTNREGATAYKLDAKMELYATSVTTMLSNKFYESGNDTLDRIKGLVSGISKTDPEFVAKLAVYAREKMYLRSLPLVLTVELAKVHKGDNLVSRTVGRVVQRADEITELLSYYSQANKRNDVKKLGKLSKQIQKGLAYSFNKFNEYAFGKYNRDGAIKLRDALFVVHPKAKDEMQQNIFNKITNDTLETPYTWEVELSKGDDKKQTWETLIDSEKVGYMATLRNLRNILQADVSKKHLVKVANFISDPEMVAASKQFPFRFLSAYREIKQLASGKASMILDALEEAMLASAKNIKGFDHGQAITISVDTSGSMDQQMSERSKITYQDVGLVLGMLLHNQCKDIETSIFGESFKTVNLPKKNILSNTETLGGYSGLVGHSTNGYLVLRDLIDRGEVKDKVMIFTDCQLWDSSGMFYITPQGHDFAILWQKYRKIAPNAKLYLFDLAGYGDTPVSTHDNGVYLIAGWSDRVFDMLDAYENGLSAIKEIEKINL